MAPSTRESMASVVQASATPNRRKRAWAIVSVVLAMTTEGTLSS